jgi:PleD family two-component response regulator
MEIAEYSTQRTVAKLPTVLIVDDVPANLDILVAHLQQENIELVVALSGEEGVSLATQLKPDLILMDVMMPGIGGFEACRQLKLNPSTATIPVIFLTAKNREKDIQQGLSLGAVDYIDKPFSLPILLARLNNHIDLKRKNDRLNQLIATNEFTLTASRKHFDLTWKREWLRARRNKTVLSLVMIEISPEQSNEQAKPDTFSREKLILAADAMMQALQRPADLLAHYEDWKFVALLPDTNANNAHKVAMALKNAALGGLNANIAAETKPMFSISQALASTELTQNLCADELLKETQKALFIASQVNKLQTVGLKHLHGS